MRPALEFLAPRPHEAPLLVEHDHRVVDLAAFVHRVVDVDVALRVLADTVCVAVLQADRHLAPVVEDLVRVRAGPDHGTLRTRFVGGVEDHGASCHNRGTGSRSRSEKLTARQRPVARGFRGHGILRGESRTTGRILRENAVPPASRGATASAHARSRRRVLRLGEDVAYCLRAAHPRMSLDRQAFRARHARTIARLYDASDAGRWRVSADTLETSLHASVTHRFSDAPAAPDVERYLESLHVKELALGVCMPRGRRPGVGTLHPRVPPRPLCGGSCGGW